MNQVAILAGGKGTRLESVLAGLPKPMAPIAGRPLLEHQITLAREHGFDEIVIFAYHKADLIRDYFGDGAKLGVRISYVIEREPLGTAGALFAGIDMLSDRFMVFYGDTMLRLDLRAMANVHLAQGADATLFIHPNDHPHDSDLVEINDKGWVTAFHPYPHLPGSFHRNLVNAALYVFERECLTQWANLGQKLDFGRDILPPLLRDGARIFGYRGSGYIKDMGTPERLEIVTQDLENGTVARKSAASARGAVFLDRDGTLNVEVNRVTHSDQLILIPGVASAIKDLNRAAIPVLVITNQPVIARGECTEIDLRKIHDKMETLLGGEGAYVNDIYYCPHHPDKGFPGERVELKFRCHCRKPSLGLIERAVVDWNINLAESWFIGDTTTDLRAAGNAGVRSILVRTGHQGRDGKYRLRPDYEFFTLNEATKFITQHHSTILEQVRELVAGIRAGDRIALGGLARCGKSTLASLIKEALRQRNLDVKILPLDNWILGESQRKGPSVRDRYDYTAIESVLEKLSVKCSSLGMRISMPAYQRHSRSRCDNGEDITLFPNDVVIVDGVIALDLPKVKNLCTMRIFCSCAEATRRVRFLKEYQLRGWEEFEAVKLFEERISEESIIVLDSAAHANLEFSFS